MLICNACVVRPCSSRANSVRPLSQSRREMLGKQEEIVQLQRAYKLRWRIENAFSRLKDFRRIATRYDSLARSYLASVCLAAALVWWI